MIKTYDLRNGFGDTCLSLMSEVQVWHLDLAELFLTADGC